MTVYLVDFENVRSAGLKGVENLDEEDKVIIFYSKNADAITFDVHMLLSKSRAEIETYMILRGGRNSLDFQLSTYLGYLVMENRFRNIVIISGDKGFLCALNFWDENKELCNANITMSKSIEAFVSNEPDDDLENEMLDSKFIEKVSVLSSKNSNEIKETVRLNETSAQDSESNEKSKSQNIRTERPNTNKGSYGGYGGYTGRSNNYATPVGDNARKTNRQSDKLRIKAVQKAREVLAVKHGQPPTKGVPQIQNPTSKNKIFAAEVKLNITDDVREIVEEKYGDQYVPMLVETIGKSTGKQHFYRMLVARLGQDVGKDIYMMIKGQYANLKRK